MRTVTFILSAAVLVAAASAQTTYSELHGYTPTSDVSSQAKIDFDQQMVMDAVAEDPVNFALAKDKYMNGGNSAGRTLQKFSTTIGDEGGATMLKMASDSAISVVQAYASYWSSNPISGDSSVTCKSGSAVTGCPNYADTIVMAALNNKGDYMLDTPGDRDVVRAQIVKKGTAYHAVWLYVVGRLSEAVTQAAKFDTTTKKMMDGKTAEETVGMAVDEAWAYHTGSQNANLPMKLAKSRGVNFGTCSAIPDALLAAFKDAQKYAATETFDLAMFTKAATDIVPLMTIPIVQGCLRYAYRADGKVMDFAAADAADLAILAEAHIFCAGLYPQMAAADAKVVRDMVDPTKKMTIVARTIKDTLERNYGVMSISPGQVGEWNAVDYECATGGASTAGSSLLLAAASVLVAFVGGRHW
mmetsp:Transcript_24233/g.55961  ORF Transcript_24233/g.55961 Transcript_24233/m.55961 type:complete len:414 (+) Transcript_24233:46-1287(+)